jgi:hypothetical protein
MTAVTRTAIVANSIIKTDSSSYHRRFIDTLVFIYSVTLVIHSSNVSNSSYSNSETTRLKRNARENVLEKIISIIKLIAIVILTNCPRCGKRIVKWFETWYAQGNCSCLSVENKTIGTRDEVY